MATNRVGRWLSIEECRANKQQLEIGLRNFAPNLAMSGLLAVAGDGGALLGGDLAIVAAWMGCLADLPGHDPATITILLVVAVIVARRHRIRAAILARR